MVQMRLCLVLAGVIVLNPALRADNIDGAVHVSGGTNADPLTNATVSAGFHLDPAYFSLYFSRLHLRSQTFEVGLAYDRVQSHNGATVDFRARVPFLRCYGWEFNCVGKRFWLTAMPSVGNRWGGGGLGGFAAAQVQAVYDFSPERACCRLALGVQHRFPFNSSLHGDDCLVLELRTFIAFIDRAPPPPPPQREPR